MICNHCKEKIKDGFETKLSIISKASKLWKCVYKNFNEELYLCDKCTYKIKDKLEAFVHRKFNSSGK